jgi:hypothetical protein
MAKPNIDPRISRRSIVDTPKASENAEPYSGYYTFRLSSITDYITPWGIDWRSRDRELREFFPTESFVAGAIYSIAAANANFRWELDGPPRTVEQVRILLNTANRGKGWIHFAQSVTIDLLTQDNGAFIEIIRRGQSEDSPVEGIAHLDSRQCVRTGDPESPVVYYDRRQRPKLLKWFQVIPVVEFPSTIESMHGIQYCGLTRVLKMAQILRDIMLYKSEKASGRFEKELHIVGGPERKEVEDVIARAHNRADEEGLTRFMNGIILTSLDPEKPVSYVKVPLAGLPDNFNYDDELKWYLAALALGFGRDYQDLAPLPGGNLGTSTQSEILHMKSKAKGPALFMRIMEYVLNFYGIMPQSITFKFEEMDPDEERQNAEVRKIRAETRKIQIESGEITPEVARQMASDDGDLDEEYLRMLGSSDATPDVTVQENEPVDEGEEINSPIPEETQELQAKYWGRIFSAATLKDWVERLFHGQTSDSETSG